MKKILILGSSMNIGGAEKSLINFLNMMDYEKYEVDLLLFQQEGPFMKQIPHEVNIVNRKDVEVLYQNIKATLSMPDKTIKDILLASLRYVSTLYEKIKWKQYDKVRIHRWIDYYSTRISELEKKYDLAIAYAGGDTAYYMVEKVQAKKKVYFFHSDYSKIDIDVEAEKKYVDLSDLIVTISDVCKQSLINLFPEKKNEIIVLNNLSSCKLINRMADEFEPKELQNVRGRKIVSVGRLHEIKGFDMAAEAASIMKKKGFQFRWVVVGDGDERAKLENMISEYALKDYFVLVGAKENPYPYIKNADVLLQTSRFEGKSVVLDEAKILGVPPIITNYNSAHDQVNSGYDGVIVDMNPQDIAKGIMSMSQIELETYRDNIIVDKSLEDIDGYMAALFGEEILE